MRPAAFALLLGSVAISGAFAQLTQCIVPSKYKCSGGTADDSPAIAAILARCSKNSEIIFSLGVEYNVFTPIKQTNLSNVVIRHLGNLNLPQNITYMQGLTAAAGGSLKWFDIRGTSVSWIGTANITTGWFKSYGQAWYDANPPGGTGLANRPHLFNFDVINGYGEYWKSSKPLCANFQLSGNNITIRNTIIDAYSNSSSFPFNTDGFGIGATNVLIENSVIYNGDDAIAVGSGSHNVVFRHATIGYLTHGMSIGSLGESPTSFANVTNILFDDVTVATGLYAARFKSYSGGEGLAQNITWQNIRAYNVSYPIFVTQVYEANAASTPNTTVTQAVDMNLFTWANFTGNINTYNSGDLSCVTNPCWYDIGLPTNLNHTEAVIIQCATSTACQNFVLENIELWPQNGAPPTQICAGVDPSTNPNFGIVCADQTYAVPFVPTVD